MVAILLHSHVVGRAVKLRHVRAGKELPVVMQDQSYDFDYQSVRLMPAPVTIMPGDELIMECDYSTKEKGEVTLGGKAITMWSIKI